MHFNLLRVGRPLSHLYYIQTSKVILWKLMPPKRLLVVKFQLNIYS